MPSQPEAQGDILKEFREGTFLSSLDSASNRVAGSNTEMYTTLIRQRSAAKLPPIPRPGSTREQRRT